MKLTLCVLLSLLTWAHGYKILFLVPFPAPSHWFWLKNFSEELLKRGHHVTAITNFERPERHSNYTEVLIEPSYFIPDDFPLENIWDLKYKNTFNNLMLTWGIGLKSTEHAFRDKNVANFINTTTEQFDVVILEQFYHDSWLPFASKFNAPIVTIATLGHADYFDHAMGLITPMSYVPHHVLPYSDRMTFVERSTNVFWGLVDAFVRRFYYMSEMQKMADKYFSDTFNGTVPSILELEKNISYRIVNQHQSMTYARPRVTPGMTYVAGIHIRQPKPLPKDIKEFLDSGSEHGVIYVSFGSCIPTMEMPPERLTVLIETFRQVKQKVLFKWENETLPNMPSNVMIRPWIPQSDVLAHENVVLYLAHGGIFGTQESVYWAKPMVMIPLFSDQFRNVMRCVDGGFAEMIQFHDLTVPALTAKLEIILNNPKYTERAQQVSAQFRDNPMDPMDESMYWIEFIARHKHQFPIFKPHGAHVPWYIYFHLDIIAAIAVVVYLWIASVKYLFKRRSSSNSTVHATKPKNEQKRQ